MQIKDTKHAQQIVEELEQFLTAQLLSSKESDTPKTTALAGCITEASQLALSLNYYNHNFK